MLAGTEEPVAVGCSVTEMENIGTVTRMRKTVHERHTPLVQVKPASQSESDTQTLDDTSFTENCPLSPRTGVAETAQAYQIDLRVLLSWEGGEFEKK